jgi:hypothetical protein
MLVHEDKRRKIAALGVYWRLPASTGQAELASISQFMAVRSEFFYF